MSKVKIGFVGVGGMGQCAHLKNYATLPDCEVVAIAEIRPNLGKAVAARYGVPRVYKDHTEMLADEKLDGIVASQPFNRHGVLVPDLYKAGIPVFTEKPLAATVEVGEKIVAALKKSKSWHMVGYHKRSDPATMHAKAEIDRLKQSGELGPMRFVRIAMPAGDWVAGGFCDFVGSDDPMPPLDLDPNPSDMNEDAFRDFFTFVNYYIHQVNLMRHLLGEPYKVTYADPSGVVLAVQSESGIAGTIEMTPYETTVDWQEAALVTFQKGYVKIDLPAPVAVNRPGKVEILRDPGNGQTPHTVVPQLPWISAMRQQAINFLRAIKGEIKPPCEAEEALEDIKVARDYIRLWKGV
ncbi:MAG: Gfo/Idh/MocA family oxidoreductase [Armatimonadota bacterium]|nr:Gfo/Idh/MocA family oxidoreductase [Armatimonadota bacterium]